MNFDLIFALSLLAWPLTVVLPPLRDQFERRWQNAEALYHKRNLWKKTEKNPF